MITIPMKMNDVLASHLEKVLSWLDVMDGSGLDVDKLEVRVRNLMSLIKVPATERRQREHYLQWLHENWVQ
jgi:hypothetical protein